MGQVLSQDSEFETFKFQYKFQELEITVKITTSIKEPDLDMPKASEINNKFDATLKKSNINKEEQDYLKALSAEIKWNLYRKHKKALDLALEEEDVIEEDVNEDDKGEYFAETFYNKCQLSNLVVFHDWLDDNHEEEISSFLAHNGMNILVAHLIKAEREVSQTFDFNKQVVLLRILTKLFDHDDVKNEIGTYQSQLNDIVMNLNPLQVEVTSLVLDILRTVIWHSEQGCEVSIVALENFQQKKCFNYLFEPFLRIIEESENIIMVNTICVFLNILVSGSSDQVNNTKLKENLLIHGISVVYGDVRLKIEDGDYKLKSSTFDQMIRKIKEKRQSGQDDQEIEQMVLNSNDYNQLFLKVDDQTGFEQQMKHVNTQIEAFEELLKEIDDDDDGSSSSSQQSKQQQDELVSQIPERPLPSIRETAPDQEKAAVKSQLRSDRSTTAQSSRATVAHHHGDGAQVDMSGRKQSIMNFKPSSLLPRGSVLDLNIQQIFIPERTVEAINDLYKKLKGCKTINDLVSNTDVFIKVSQQAGVNIITKLIESIQSKIKELQQQGELQTRGKSESRIELEQQAQNLSEKSIYYELEISKMQDQKMAHLEMIQSLKNQKKASPQTPNPPSNQQEMLVEGLSGQVKLQNGKILDLNFIRDQVKSLQQGLVDAHKLVTNQKKMKLLGRQVDEQRIIIETLKNRMTQSVTSFSETSDENFNAYKEELKQSYEIKIKASDQALKKYQVESRFTLSIIQKTKDNLRKKVEEQQQKIILLEANQKAVIKEPSIVFQAKELVIEQINKIAPPPPPPPPPPPAQQDNEELKIDTRVRRLPKQMMKNVYWAPVVQTKTFGTIWHNVDDSKIVMDYEYLEEWFSQSTQAPVAIKAPIKANFKESNLRPERAKNVELVLCRLKASHAMITNSLWLMDETTLNPELVESLLKIVPSEQEALIFRTNKTLDKSKLATPDIFFMELVKIPDYDTRLYALKAQSIYKDGEQELRIRMRKLQLALHKQLSDENLKEVLIYALAVGNFLNGNTNRKDSYGFKLSEVCKLLEIRSTYDSNKTVLGYIINQLEKDKQTDFINVNESFADLEFLSSFPFSQFNNDIDEIKKDLQQVESAIASQTQNEFDKVTEKLAYLPEIIKKDLQWLEVETASVNKQYESVCSFYCENHKILSADQFFSYLLDFKVKCRTAKQLIEKQKINEEKEKEKIIIQELQKKRQLEQQVKQQANVKDNQKANPRRTIYNDISKVNDKSEVLTELRTRRDSKSQNTVKTSNSSLAQLMAMQKKLKEKKT